MGNSKIKLILASTSPRRKELLGHVKVPFEIYSENIPEITNHTDPVEYCRDLALMKGKAVFDKLKVHPNGNSLLVVSADTIVCLKERIFNKPADRNEAREFLTALSGQTHSVFTAVAFHLIHQGIEKKHSFVDETKVTFDKISHESMERYLDTGDSLDKAGAYGIQSGSLTFISRVEGSYSTVVGFPLSRFMQEVDMFLKQSFPQEDVWQNLF